MKGSLRTSELRREDRKAFWQFREAPFYQKTKNHQITSSQV